MNSRNDNPTVSVLDIQSTPRADTDDGTDKVPKKAAQNKQKKCRQYLVNHILCIYFSSQYLIYLSGIGGKKLLARTWLAEDIPSDEDDSEDENDLFDAGNSTLSL